MTSITRRPKLSPIETARPLVQEFGGHRSMLKKLTKRSNELKETLMGLLEQFGVADDKGSLWFEFDEPIGGFDAIKRERRAQVLLNQETTEVILERAGLYDACVDVDITIDATKQELVLDALRAAGIYDEVVLVTHRLNDEKIMAAYFAEKEKKKPKLTDADIDAMFDEKVTWAFVVRDAV